MAAAQSKTVAEEVITIKESKAVTLELDEMEARVLYTILGWHVIGDAPGRDHSSQIWLALDRVGLEYTNEIFPATGSVTFKSIEGDK